MKGFLLGRSYSQTKCLSRSFDLIICMFIIEHISFQINRASNGFRVQESSLSDLAECEIVGGGGLSSDVLALGKRLSNR